MGVIIRQGLKHSVVTVLATAVGMINVLLIYTNFLTEQELGLFQYLVSWAKFLVPFLALGIGATAVRFFSVFQNKSEKNNGFLFFVLLIPIISFSLFFIFSWLFKDFIFASIRNHPDVDLLTKYLPYSLIVLFGLLMGGVMTVYIANYKLITVPEIFNNLWIKIAIPCLAVLYYFEFISFNGFILGLVSAYLVSTISLFFYAWRLGILDLKPNMTFFDKPILKEIRNYAAFSLFGGLGTIIATQIDTLMVGSLIDLENAGIYTIALYISTVIGIPLKSVFSITSPIVAESINNKDFANVQKLYFKSSLNLFVIGLLILIGIWASVDYLFQIIPNGESYKAGKYVILLLGIAKIIDMATSINTHIIVYSEHYRFNLYFSLILAILNVIFNLLFIPIFGLVGVAIATLTSMFLFNLLKVIFVWIKFKMQPFSKGMLWVLFLGLISYGITFLLPKTGYPIIDIIINSVSITAIYVPCILYFNLSDDLTLIKQQIIKKIKPFLP